MTTRDIDSMILVTRSADTRSYFARTMKVQQQQREEKRVFIARVKPKFHAHISGCASARRRKSRKCLSRVDSYQQFEGMLYLCLRDDWARHGSSECILHPSLGLRRRLQPQVASVVLEPCMQGSASIEVRSRHGIVSRRREHFPLGRRQNSIISSSSSSIGPRER